MAPKPPKPPPPPPPKTLDDIYEQLEILNAQIARMVTAIEYLAGRH